MKVVTKKMLLVMCSLLFALALSLGLSACVVTNGITWISVSETSVELYVGDTEEVEVEVIPPAAYDDSWYAVSEDESVAAITYSNDDNSIEITAVSAGETSITVGSAANSNVKTFIKVTVMTAVTGVTLDETSVEMTAGESLAVTATVEPGDATNKAVSWSSSDESVATVKDGVVTAVAAGTATITVTTEDGGYTATLAVTVKQFAVTASPETLELIAGGADGTVSVSVTAENSTDETWGFNVEPADESVIEVTASDDGLSVHAVSAGTAVITVYANGDSSKTATVEVTVIQLMASITADMNYIALPADVISSPISITASDATDLTWTAASSDPSVAAVSLDGDSFDSSAGGEGNGTIYIKGVSVGDTTVTISSNDGNASYTISVSVTETGNAFSITSYVTTMYVGGDSYTFKATLYFSSGSGITDGFAWTSSDPSVATVDSETGVVTPVGKGTTTITATNTFNGETFTVSNPVELTVEQLVEKITVNGETETTVEAQVDGASADVTVAVSPDNANNSGWTYEITSGDDLITVAKTGDGTGLTISAISGVSAGTAVVIVSAADASGVTAAINVTVTAAAVTGITIDGESSAEVTVQVDGDGAEVAVAVQPSYAGNTDWTFEITSGDTLVTAEKTQDGTGISISAISGASAGTATITVTASGDSSKTAEITVNVTAASVTGITVNKERSATVTVQVDGNGAEVAVAVQPSYAGNTDWTFEITSGDTLVTAEKTQDGTSLSISAISGASAGTATITVTASGDISKTAEITVNITAASVTGITVNGEAAASVEVQVDGDGAEVAVAVQPSYAGDTGWTYEVSGDSSSISVSKDDASSKLTISAVSGSSAGTAYITVTSDEGGYTAQITVNITAASVTGITVSQSEVTVQVDGDGAEVTVAVQPSYAGDTGWSIGTYDSSLLDVSKDGSTLKIFAVSGVSATTTTVTVYADGDTTKTAEITVNITAASVTGITVNGENSATVTVQVDGDGAEVAVAVQPSYAGNTDWTFEITSGDTLVTAEKTQDGTGLSIAAISGASAGTAIITVTASGDISKTAEITVNVTAASVTGITVNGEAAASVEVQVDGTDGADTAAVEVAIVPTYAGNTGWSFEITEGASLITAEKNTEGTGLVITASSGAKSGSAAITVYSDEDSSISAAVSVTVLSADITSVETSAANGEISLALVDNPAADVTVTVNPSYADDTSWTAELYSGDAGIVTFTAGGSSGGTLEITAQSAGTVTIRVSSAADKNIYTDISVTVSPKLVTSITADPASVSLTVGGQGQDVTVSVSADATNPAWTVTGYDSGIVSVETTDNGITISPVAHGTTTVVITASDGSGVTCSIDVAVAEFGISAAPNPLNISGLGSTGTITVSVSHEDSDDAEWAYEITSGGEYISAAKTDAGLTITAVASGTATIVFTADGDSSKTAEVTVNVTNPVTAVSISGTDSEIKVGETATVSITVTPSGADDESWTIAVTGDSGAVTLSKTSGSGSDTVTATGTASGTAVITVTSDADGSLSDSVTITVIQLADSITTSAADNAVEITLDAADPAATAEITVTVGPEGATDKTWTAASSNTDVAAVSPVSDGTDTLTITGLKSGTAEITITSTDGNATATITVTVIQLVTEITTSETSVSLTVNGSNNTAAVTVSVEPSDADVQTWTATSNNESIATVSQDGDTITITAVATGSTSIIIASADGGAEAVVYVSVTNPISGISISSNLSEITVGGEAALSITVTPSDADEAGWTISSNSDAVTLGETSGDGTGTVTVTGAKSGSATITVTSKADSGITAEVTITVTNPITGIDISAESASITVGSSTTAIITVTPANADETGWTISVTGDSDAVTLSQSSGSGEQTITITGAAAGEAVITVTSTADDSISDYVTITVSTVPVTEITATPGAVTLTDNGDSETVSVSVSPDNATNGEWTAVSGNDSVATITYDSGSITITPAGVGSTTITITASDGSGVTATINVTVEAKLVTSITPSETSVTLTDNGDSETVSVSVSPDNATNGAWTAASNDTSIATISYDSNSITITPAGVGTTTITITASDGSGVTATINVTVEAKLVTSISASGTSVNLILGKDESDATAAVTITVEPSDATNTAWTAASSNESVATVTSGGTGSGEITITAVGAGTATITVTAADGSGKTATIAVNVTVAVSGVSIDQGNDTVTIEYGNTATLTATVTPDNASDKTVTWSSSDTSVATVGEDTGIVTAVGYGTATITVRTEDGEYEDSIEILVPNHVTAVTVKEDDTEVSDVYAIVDGDAVVLTVTLTAQDSSKPITYDGWTAEIVSGEEYISIRTVNDNIRITGIAGGEATIDVTPNDTTYASAKTITVKVIEASITGNANIIIYDSDATTTTLTLNLTNLTSEDITSVTWNSSNIEIATVAGNGSPVTTATVTKASDDQFGSTTITATADTVYGTVTATYMVCVTANYFYLAGVNQDSWTSDYDSADAAKEAGVLLEASDDNPYVYSVTIHINLDNTPWGFAICFDGMTADNAWDYAIMSGSAYYDEAHSSAEYVTSYDGNLQVNASGDYVITLDFSAGGPAVLTIRQAGIDVDEVTLTLTSGSGPLDSTTNTSVTYTYSVGPADAQYSNDEVNVELISFVDGWESYMELDTDYTSNTVTVTCIGDPSMTFTLTLVVTIQNVESNLMYITVSASSGTTVDIDKITYDEDSYSYNVNNGGSAWTTTVHALATDAEGNVASDETVTYAPAAGYEDYITVKTTSKGGVVTATTLGTFKVTATSNGDSSITADIEVTFYSDTFYLYIGSTGWTVLDQTETTIEGTKVADLGLTAADSTNKVFTGTFKFTSTYTDSEFYILYLGWAGWGDNGFTVNGDFLDMTNSTGAYVNTGNEDPEKDDDHFQVTTAGTYTITVDLSGTTPAVTISLVSSGN
ncbi:MAG: Ig-like domain-containing protein [Clostridia bacterium]|nr:Ig-like domain-containing protein [Clostridia bacterium]